MPVKGFDEKQNREFFIENEKFTLGTGTTVLSNGE
jgi:hypothetical protein